MNVMSFLVYCCAYSLVKRKCKSIKEDGKKKITRKVNDMSHIVRKKKLIRVHRDDTNQPFHLHNLSRVFAGHSVDRLLQVTKTRQMHRLVIFSVGTRHRADFFLQFSFKGKSKVGKECI